MLGLKPGTVKLASHHKQWVALFEEEKQCILSILKGIEVSIEHVGSTAVQGLKAKPILDMVLAVSAPAQTKKVYKILEKNGYRDRGELGIADRHLFIRGPEDWRTHHLHVTLKNSNFWVEHILFRDYLRAHKSALTRYNTLKKKLAKQFANDRESYTKAKRDFIQGILVKSKKLL